MSVFLKDIDTATDTLKDRPQPHIIAFVGTVGAGKSTQMRLLASRLREKGLRVKVTSLKINHLPAFLLVAALAKILVANRKDVFAIRALIEGRPSLFRRLFKLWIILDVGSIFARFLFTIYFFMKTSYLVIVEEYIPATIADYIYLSRIAKTSSGTVFFAIKLVLKLAHIGGPVQIVFLDANIDVLKSRWGHRGSLNEKLDYLLMQRTTLSSIAEKISCYRPFYVNTSKQTVAETHELILNYLMRLW